MKRIIVEFPDDMNPVSAMWRAFKTVQEGKISSDTRGVRHYCWCTVMGDGSKVYARKKRSITSADSLVVEEKPSAKDS